MNSESTFNEDEQRYEMAVDEHIVYANIRHIDDVVYIDHVFAPPALRGKGAAGKFMTALMERLRADGLKAKPICGYAASWLRRHSEFHDILVSD